MPICPNCGGTGHISETAEDRADQLRRACSERGIWVSADDRVREESAADLLGVAVKTMRNWRYGARPIAAVTRSGRPLYALADLAAWQVANEN